MPRTISEVAPEARVPPEVEALVMRVLSKDADKRPDSAEALVAELTRAREAAVVTSGVRASLAGPLDGVLEPAPSAAPVAPPTPASFSNDTLSGPAGLPSSARRWAAPAIAVALMMLVAAFAVVYVSNARRAPAATTATPPTTTTVAVTPPPPPATTPAPVAAPSSTIPSIAATALPIPAPDPSPGPGVRSPRRGGRPGTGPRPAGSSSVGYGYLE